jgi:hypothetical protein
MGLFSRFKSMFSSSVSSNDTDHQHHRHDAADFAEEQAAADEDTRSGGLLGPRRGMGSGLGSSVVNDPSAEAEIRTSANEEDDGSREMMIEQERRDAEHGE